MKARRGLTAVAAAAVLALSGAGAAFADESPTTPTREPGARQGPKCDRVEHVITNLEQIQTKLEAKIKRVEEKIASGDLSEKRLANAKRFLAKLQHRLEKLEALIERMQTKFAEKCQGTTDGDSDGDD